MKNLPARLLQQPRLSHFLGETVKRYRVWTAVILLLRTASLAEKLLWPLFIKWMTDMLAVTHATGVTDWNRIIWILIYGFCVWAIPEVSDVAANVFSGRRIAAMRAEIRLFVLHDLYKQSQQFFHDRFAGSISTSMRDLSEGISDILNEIVHQIIPAILVFFVTAYVFFTLDIRYSILLFVWMTLQISLIFFTKLKSQKKSRDYADERSELIGKLIDSITNYQSVASFTAHGMEHQQITQAESDVVDRRADVVNYSQLVYLGSGILEVCTVFFGFFSIYLYLFNQGRATVGDLLFMIMGIYGMMSIVRQISNRFFWLYEQIGIGQEAIRKIIVPRQIMDAENAHELEIKQASIDIDHLDFSYLPDKPVLTDVSFTVRPGEKTGLVGYSGAGKTTFVNLLMRFYEASAGSIRIGGQDITSVTQESLRRHIALIPQDTSLFHRSLRENIRIARPEATDEEIMTAAKMAGAHDFIMNQAKHYDTLVGERGIKLSGGQRQRIAIARAFLKAAPILVLDEATSALDSVTEQGIQDALDLVMAGRTTLVIAHRLSTLRRMDRVLVFDKGRIIEDGTHAALIAQNGVYARMWTMQAGGFLPEKERNEQSPA